MAKLDFFPLGSSYYPPYHTPEDWERDVGRMAEAQLNAMRTAELIASWEWIEPQRGVFDFGWLDRIFELAEQHGLRILLGTGSCSPPIWLLDEYPDVQVLSQDGIPFPTGTRWGWACIDNPGYLAEAERYLLVLLERYADHPALLGWQIDNEIGYPTRRMSGLTEFYCYCEHTAARFREWLQSKYDGDIEALSEAWVCTPTRHRYHDWAQVRPPRSTPVGYRPIGSPGPWLDWQTFINQNFADFIAWQNEIIKTSDAEHPTTTNLVGLMSVPRGVDVWRYPDTVDALGFDLYPVNRPLKEPSWISQSLDYARSPALHAGKPFWLPEIESGPIGGWVLGPGHATTAQDIRRYNLESIAHGAKMILYQGYREWDPLPMHWGALVDLHGEPTERYEAARQVNQMVAEHETLFLEAEPVRAQVAILWDQANAIAVYGMGGHEFLLQAVRGVYGALWSQGLPVEFITPDLLAAGSGVKYRLILMPFMMLVTEEGGRALAGFVSRGGTLVAFAKCAMLDGRSWYWRDRPGAGLASLFGVRERLIQMTDSVALLPESNTELFDGVAGPLDGHWHRQDFVLADDVDVLARYPDGQPAVSVRAHGAGRAVAFGTHFDVATLLSDDSQHNRVYTNLARMAGVERPFLLNGDAHLDGHLLARGDERLFIVANHGPSDVKTTVYIPAISGDARVTNLFTGQRLESGRDREGLSFDITVSGYDGAALLIE